MRSTWPSPFRSQRYWEIVPSGSNELEASKLTDSPTCGWRGLIVKRAIGGWFTAWARTRTCWVMVDAAPSSSVTVSLTGKVAAVLSRTLTRTPVASTRPSLWKSHS